MRAVETETYDSYLIGRRSTLCWPLARIDAHFQDSIRVVVTSAQQYHCGLHNWGFTADHQKSFGLVSHVTGLTAAASCAPQLRIFDIGAAWRNSLNAISMTHSA
jgi:hypothetical protein